jgi:hypothetical protein
VSSAILIVFIRRVRRCFRRDGEFLLVGLALLLIEAAVRRFRLSRLRRGALSRQGRFEIAQACLTGRDPCLSFRKFCPGFFKRGFSLLDGEHGPGLFFRQLFLPLLFAGLFVRGGCGCAV